MVAVAVVEVAVEGLLLGEALGGVGADGGADVAEDRRRLAAGLARRPASTCSRAPAANSGVIQLKKAPSNSAPASAHIFGPIAARTRRTPGSRSRSSRQRLAHPRQGPLGEAGADAEPEPRRVEAEPLDVGGDLLRRGAVEGDHARRRARPRAPPRRTRPASPAPWRRDGRWTRSSRSRARRSGRPAAAPPRGRAPRPRRSRGAGSRPSPSSATHSMCGVWGNMSTGLTRRSL